MSKHVTESLVFRPASELPTAETLMDERYWCSTPVMVGMMDLSVLVKRMARYTTLAFTLGWVAKCCHMISKSPGRYCLTKINWQRNSSQRSAAGSVCLQKRCLRLKFDDTNIHT